MQRIIIVPLMALRQYEAALRNCLDNDYPFSYKEILQLAGEYLMQAREQYQDQLSLADWDYPRLPNLDYELLHRKYHIIERVVNQLDTFLMKHYPGSLDVEEIILLPQGALRVQINYWPSGHRAKE